MNPHQEAERLIQLAAQYQALSEEQKGMVRVKAGVWRIIRENVKSVAEADRQWEGREEGIREREIEIELKSLEKNMSAIKSMLRTWEIEARNLY